MPRMRYRIFVIGWAVVSLLVVFFDSPLQAALWVLVVPIWLALAGLGLCLALIGVILAFQRSVGRWDAAAPLLVLLALVLGHHAISGAGDRAVFALRFRLLRPRYEEVLARVGRGQLAIDGKYRGVRYMCESLHPLRVAFRQPGGGIDDSWEGVIYDPTHVVRAAKGWNGKPGNFSAPPEVRRMFGGNLLECRPIEGAYYRCWFT